MIRAMAPMLPYVLVIYMVVFWFGGLYEIMWEYAGMRDLARLTCLSGLATGFILLFDLIFRTRPISGTVLILGAVFTRRHFRNRKCRSKTWWQQEFAEYSNAKGPRQIQQRGDTCVTSNGKSNAKTANEPAITWHLIAIKKTRWLTLRRMKPIAPIMMK